MDRMTNSSGSQVTSLLTKPVILTKFIDLHAWDYFDGVYALVLVL